jgi:hypothetical protein
MLHQSLKELRLGRHRRLEDDKRQGVEAQKLLLSGVFADWRTLEASMRYWPPGDPRR